MKKSFSVYPIVLAAAFICLFLGNCKKPERVIKIVTLDVRSQDITHDTVIIKGEIIDIGDGALSNHGILLRKSDQAGDNFPTNLSLGSSGNEGVFSVKFTSTLPDTEYEYKAYAGNTASTVYGETKTFTTPALTLPELTTAAVTEITTSSARSGGSITSDGGAAITARGICWSTTENPTTDDNKTDDPNPGTGEFVNHLAWLTPNTTYYVRAYATNSVGTAYGNQVTFSTQALELPEINTQAADEITAASAKLWAEVTGDGGAEVFDRGFCYGTETSPDHNDDVVQNDQNGTGQFSEQVGGLVQETTYYVRSFATNSVGTQYGNEISFSTDGPPVIEVSPATGITAYTADITASITSDGGDAVYERGICLGTDPDPDVNSAITDDQNGEGQFLMELTDLMPNTTYYVRAYALNTVGLSYSDEIQFTTLAYANTGTFIDERDGIEYTWVEIGSQIWMAENLKHIPGEISPPNVSSYLEAYCYVYDYQGTSVDEAMATENYSTYGVLYNWKFAMWGSDSYDGVPGMIQGMCPDGWHLPTDSEWQELEMYLGMTFEDAELTGQRGDISGLLKETGTQHWSETNASVTNNSGFTALPGGKRNYNDEFTGLNYDAHFWSSTEDDDTYAFDRALDYNSGVVYRNYTDKTQGLSIRCIKGQGAIRPSLETADPYNITTGSAILGGNITDNGNGSISERGIYYGNSANPIEFDGTKVSIGSGTGAFETDITGLTAGTTYYVVAYARNEAGTSYGSTKTFTTNAVPTVTTVSVGSISDRSAECTGNVTDNGSSIAGDRGFCYNTTGSPTITDNIVQNDVNGTGEFTETISELNPGTTYYVRAYGKNNEGTGYGEQIEFTTLTLPTLTTEAVINIDYTRAESGGNITDNGGSAVTARGICWSMGPAPDLAGNYTTNGSGTGSYSSTMTGLDPGTTYYVKAYATNSAGTEYGQEETFTTKSLSTPTVNTGNAYNITDVSATADGEITDDGGSAVTERGICYGTASSPTLSDNIVTSAGDIGSFSVNLTGLTPGTTYYYRAYATNSIGTTYGEQMIIKTMSDIVTDIDGNEYFTIIIGGQEWMAENLRVTSYSDGTSINHISNDADWAYTYTSNIGAYAVYPHEGIEGLNSENEVLETFGALYNWFAVETAKLCPAGWHVPSDDEWTIMQDYLIENGYNYDNSVTTGDRLAKSLASTTGWQSSTNEGVPGNTDYPEKRNITGFSALPSGERDSDGEFLNYSITGRWWASSLSIGETYAYYFYIDYDDRSAHLSYIIKSKGYSVRCLKD